MHLRGSTVSILSNLWDIVVWFFMIFVFVAYLMALFSIISDLFRDRELGGWAKALWLVFLVFLPFLTALVYLIARGRGMAERSVRQAKDLQAAQDQYIREVAGGPAQEIQAAKALLDSGAITQAEFDAIKAKALA